MAIDFEVGHIVCFEIEDVGEKRDTHFVMCHWIGRPFQKIYLKDPCVRCITHSFFPMFYTLDSRLSFVLGPSFLTTTSLCSKKSKFFGLCHPTMGLLCV